MAECLAELAGRMGRREIVMIFSDFFTDLDELETALQLMRYHRHEVVLFHVMHHDELFFEFDGMVKFLGLEVDEQFLTQPSDVRRAYLEELQRFQTAFEELCHRNRIERVLVDTRRNMGEVFLDYLNQRAMQRNIR